MLVTRTRTFGIIVIFAQSEFNFVGSPLYGGYPQKRHTVSQPEELERLRRTVRAKRARAAGMSPAARALRSDVVRRAASRGGTLRCARCLP